VNVIPLEQENRESWLKVLNGLSVLRFEACLACLEGLESRRVGVGVSGGSCCESWGRSGA